MTNKNFKTSFMTAFLPTLTALLALLFASACGPMPPEDPFHLAEAKDSLGRGYHWYLRGCNQEALRFFSLGLEEARLSDNVALIVKSLNFMGVAMIAQGDLNSAALTLEQALILSEAEPVPPELDSLWGNLGLLAFKAGRFADAAELWRRAAEEAEARNLSPSLYHSNLARLYLSQGRDSEFKQEVAFALASSLEPATTRSARAEALNLAAMAALSEDKPTEAQLHIDAALQLDREDENQTGLAQDLEILAELMIKTGSLKQAASNLDRAFYLWAALGDKEAQRRVFEQMRNLEKQTTLAKSLSSYQEVLNTPALFDPINRLCP